ncbi:hypothetical protein NPIL_361531 [Nephila pilipes]|uniref:Uncharacterized protein n=1 Tax=Nephila pilipes TaxID=299642 RepID=A0A8X6Q2G5_NEPPI|nr:hypothetical protein NPIL_361531 [Nephila pilipes]
MGGPCQKLPFDPKEPSMRENSNHQSIHSPQKASPPASSAAEERLPLIKPNVWILYTLKEKFSSPNHPNFGRSSKLWAKSIGFGLPLLRHQLGKSSGWRAGKRRLSSSAVSARLRRELNGGSYLKASKEREENAKRLHSFVVTVRYPEQSRNSLPDVRFVRKHRRE